MIVRSVLMVLVYILLPLAGGVWAFVAMRRSSGQTDRLLRVMLPLTTALSGGTLLVMSFYTAQGLQLDWNGGKLAPIVAMVLAEPKGEPLYQDRDTGVMTAWIYGPVPAILFLPAAFFSRPSSVITTGILINAICALGPAAWAHRRSLSNRSREQVVIALLMFGLFIWIGLMHESLRRAIYIVGPDGPAIGFAALASVLLMRKRQHVQLALAALCAVLSCWSKQTMLPFVLAAPIYLFVIDRRIALRYLLYLLGIGVVVSGILILAFGPARNMWFHMVTIPAHHPWQQGISKPMALWRSICELVFDSAEMIALVLGVILILMFGGALRNARTRDGFRQWLDANPWLLFALSGILLLPSAIVGHVKIGGYVNNFALFGYMITLAATVAITMNFPRIDPPALRNLVTALASGAILVRTMQMVILSGNFPAMWTRVRDADDNQQEYVYDFAMEHPGIVYFPWNNLSTLLAEKKLYHFEWGIVDRSYSPVPWTPEQLRAHIPANARAIGFGPLVQSMNALQLFPDATEQQPPRSDLPGFVLATHPGTQLPPPPTTSPSTGTSN